LGCSTSGLRVRYFGSGRRSFVWLWTKILGKIFGVKRKQVTEDWRKLRHEELHDIVFQTLFFCDQMKEGEIDGVCGMHGVKGNVHMELKLLNVRTGFSKPVDKF
jgi:hypothetical protein